MNDVLVVSISLALCVLWILWVSNYVEETKIFDYPEEKENQI